MSSLEKDHKFKLLEDLVIKIRYDPNDVKAAESITIKKNEYIIALKKQLKLPSIEDHQTKEIEESEQHKEEILNLSTK